MIFFMLEAIQVLEKWPRTYGKHFKKNAYIAHDDLYYHHLITLTMQ